MRGLIIITLAKKTAAKEFETRSFSKFRSNAAIFFSDGEIICNQANSF